ncbi:hypothetical protein C1Y63_06590 [Corynebacterium sp. 13CS0277]|uniref:hypothetical protein n=1 Tax=Corynebacterium sp. 13CS0277 TaxID=2071994 RepID=UPI000D023889|nr:hypothetical protein [Corynebacterium sp. 13CS0277]PRQ11370.1 hypothetical protein C1Y63_06590 [Corynebacterium sp. 13CS0277]
MSTTPPPELSPHGTPMDPSAHATQPAAAPHGAGHAAAFEFLYPDIDPGTPLAARPAERLGMGAAVAVLAAGVAMSNLVLVLAGAVLAVVASLAASQSPLRRVRAEARARFPQAGWAENHRLGLTHRVAFACAWVLIAALPAVSYLWVPPADSHPWGLASALIALVIVWFLPGLNPVWNRLGHTRPPQADAVEPASADPLVELEDYSPARHALDEDNNTRS